MPYRFHYQLLLLFGLAWSSGREFGQASPLPEAKRVLTSAGETEPCAPNRESSIPATAGSQCQNRQVVKCSLSCSRP